MATPVSTTTRLLAWFDGNRRPLPWRRPADRADPYRVLVAEVMLQQTRVESVVPYYLRWTDGFPDFRALAAAPESEVLRMWEGLGYYRRARNLKRTAELVVAQHGGRLPSDPGALAALPGIGSYTAAAVRALAFGEAVIAADGNVRRVAARLAAATQRPSPVEAAMSLAALACGPRANEVTEALIELGALVCTPTRPDCQRCPLRTVCAAAASTAPERYPQPVPRAAVPLRERDALVAIVTTPRPALWLVQRPSGGLLGGLWGFPQVERGAWDAHGTVLAEVGPLRHAYSHFRLELRPLRVPPSRLCERVPGSQRVPLDDLGALPLSTLDRVLVRRLAAAGVLGGRYRAA